MNDEELRNRLSAVYRERNLMAMALASILHVGGAEAGWYRDHSNDHEWPVVWVDLANGDDTQMGWHAPPGMIPLLENSRLPQEECVYDGHNRADRNNRLMSIIEAGDSS